MIMKFNKASGGGELVALTKMVDAFANAMKERLEAKLDAGKTGWDNADNALDYRLRLGQRAYSKDSTDENLIDIANLAMMVWNLPRPISEVRWSDLAAGDQVVVETSSGSKYTLTLLPKDEGSEYRRAEIDRVRHGNLEEQKWGAKFLMHDRVLLGKALCYSGDVSTEHSSSTPIRKITVILKAQPEPTLTPAVAPEEPTEAPVESTEPL